MLSKTVLVSALAGLAAAAPAPAARQSSGSFSAIATRSGSPIHLSSIHANGGKFWIGKETASYCPVDPSSCPPGQDTAFSAGAGGLALDVVVPGGQQAYVDPTGALSFTQAHSAAIPEGSITTGFSYNASTGANGLGSLTFGNATTGFFACPSEGNATTYQIFAGSEFDSSCYGFGFTTAPFEGAAAWQYT
ncbi:IgE-binding protein [Phlyctema vagabunda]|uniref:IgE-binding protein n=1 Tax=Phlyctema vagabunda TaxID=108571 RepID=A0ABR4PXU6_9HELO